MRILELLIFDASFSVRVANGGWRFDFNAESTSSGLVTIDGHGFLDSKGNFDITLQGRFVIGSDDFGLSGQATFRVWNTTTSDPSGNPIYDFGLSIDASLRARLFGITLAGVGFNVTFTASNRANASGASRSSSASRSTSRSCSSRSRKTATFSLGYLQFPPPVFLAGASDGPRPPSNPNWNPDWATDGDPGTAARCTSTWAARPESRTSGRGVTDEVYYISDGGFDDSGVRCQGRRVRSLEHVPNVARIDATSSVAERPDLRRSVDHRAA